LPHNAPAATAARRGHAALPRRPFLTNYEVTMAAGPI
jgi:hypothetical protein